MPKILTALLAFAMLTGAASAQQRTYYDSSGRSLGTSSTDSQICLARPYRRLSLAAGGAAG